MSFSLVDKLKDILIVGLDEAGTYAEYEDLEVQHVEALPCLRTIIDEESAELAKIDAKIKKLQEERRAPQTRIAAATALAMNMLRATRRAKGPTQDTGSYHQTLRDGTSVTLRSAPREVVLPVPGLEKNDPEAFAKIPTSCYTVERKLNLNVVKVMLAQDPTSVPGCTLIKKRWDDPNAPASESLLWNKTP